MNQRKREDDGEGEQVAPGDRVLGLVDAPARTKEVWVGSEPVTIESRVRWADSKQCGLRVEATAYGPSCHHVERLREVLVLEPD